MQSNHVEFVTFLLAMIGYAGLCHNTILAVKARFNRKYMAVVAGVIVIHVFMVWAFRYEWAFSQATRNGFIGFALFHGALLLILGSVFIRAATADALVVAAFIIVTMGAIGATFKYEVVAMYQIPVMLTALAGLFVLGKSYFDKRRLAKSAKVPSQT